MGTFSWCTIHLQVYQLCPASNSEGAAITNFIMDAAENDRTKLTVIVAGYTDKIEKEWLAFNPGLSSRFTIKVEFEDFDAAQLRAAVQGMVKEKHWRFERLTGAVDVATLMANRLARGANKPGFANARSARGLVEAAMKRATERIGADPDFQVKTLTFSSSLEFKALTTPRAI